MPTQYLHAVTQFADANTWEAAASMSMTFICEDTTEAANVNDVNELVTSFFNTTVEPGIEPPAYYLSDRLSRATDATVTDIYDITEDLTGQPTGSPIFTNAWSLAGGSATFDLPVATCITLSYRADYGTAVKKGASSAIPTPSRAQKDGAPPTHTGFIRPQQRLRGRIYFGPLNGNASASAQGAVGSNSGEVVDHQAMVDLTASLNALAFTPVTQLGVWSRSGGVVNPAVYIYVDGGFSYRRKRAHETNGVRVHPWVPTTAG